LVDIGAAVALIIAEDDAVRDSLTVLLEALRLVVYAYERVEGYLRDSAAVHHCHILVTYQKTSALGLRVVRELRDLDSAPPAIILAAKIDPAITIQAAQSGATVIEAPSMGETLRNAIQGALQPTPEQDGKSVGSR
jgi:FixJ family two-component response regulator